MTHQEEPDDSGRNLGMEGVEHVAGRAEAYCECERERIALVNEPRIKELCVFGSHLAEREASLQDRLRRAAPPGDVRQRRRKAGYYCATGIILAFAAFCFSLIGFAPFRSGWMGCLYCLGIAIATPFATEEFLDAWRSERLLKGVAAAVFLAALVGGALLAEIRGDLFARQAEQPEAAVVVEGSDPASARPHDTFYESTRDLLRAMMVLFAFAIDIGAGVAVHRALALGAVSGEDADGLLMELGDVRRQLGATVAEITALTNAPAVFATRFWRDFYRAMLTQTARRAIAKGLGLAVFACALWSGRALAGERRSFVAMLDLSASEAAKGPDGKMPFERNVEGIARLLAAMPAGSHVTVIGITKDSIADPASLLSASISADAGYFGERLAAGRAELVSVWRARAARLRPSARGTDIIGSLFLAGEIFRNEPRGSPKTLVIFSDMRNATRALNLEARHPGTADSILAALKAQRRTADLTGVTVYVVGANGGGRDIGDWQAVKEFWIAYFGRAGARCGGYSTLITVPTLAQ
ncbi:MAG: vWA domain-containing protein [Bryobacteraceae bacterium]